MFVGRQPCARYGAVGVTCLVLLFSFHDNPMGQVIALFSVVAGGN